MAKRTTNALAKVIARRIDKDPSDTTFVSFAEECIVLTLQEIIAAVPYARWLLDEDSIATVASTQYATWTSDADIDNIVTLRDETNNRELVRISPEDADKIDPGRDLSGPPEMWWWQRVGGSDRIYFLPKPDAIYTIKAIFSNLVDDPATGATSPLPAKYESTLLDGAIAKMFPRIPGIDPDYFQKRFMGGYNAAGEPTGLAAIIRDAKKARGESGVISSHRPGTHTNEFGPRFPADFDILP